jgi:hypothetical protein
MIITSLIVDVQLLTIILRLSEPGHLQLFYLQIMMVERERFPAFILQV